MSIVGKLEVVKDMIQSTVNQGVKTAEDIHIAIGDIAFEVLEQQGRFDEEAKALREQHTALVKTIYGKIREVNDTVGEFASDIFENIEDSEVILKNMADKETKEKTQSDS
ncbi:MAG: hypothetical protein CSA49_07660 [Gammaproteobacteria bacterium]|nr:MAG: hypothetical protein CSA49_07660 [Gammaproteobacteria bacterium]